MNNEYADWLEAELCGDHLRETDLPPMADDPESFQGEPEDEIEDETPEHFCPLCGCEVARWAGSLGNVTYYNCRNCGHTSYVQ
jgi:predicted RNA-binding Zn-ribbon protein involved in translation (DUF1610 family)